MDERLKAEGPAAYFTELPIRTMLEALKEAKIPAEISNSAGTYGCNQIFYHLMDYLAREKMSSQRDSSTSPAFPSRW